MAKTDKNYKRDPLLENADFIKIIIDSLPGIFYFYHVTDEGIFLKRWNKVHVTEMGYSDEELLNINVSVFFTKNEFLRVEKLIRQVFVNGYSDTYTTIITKAGKHIPYYIQGYALYIDGEKYVIGVGINMSDQQKLEERLKYSQKQQLKEKSEKKKIDELLKEKKRELLTQVISETHNLQNIREARNRINKLIIKHSGTDIGNEMKEIDKILTQSISKDEQWQLFKLSFTEIHPNFFKKLKEKHPNLTNSEIRFCVYLRMHLSSSQMLAALNISKEGVRKARYRIRKKMGLGLKDILEDYISEF